MSSHHIIREKQEPALLILSLENFPADWLGQLLEWSPTLIAVANVAEALEAEDVKVDYVLGDGAAITSQSHVKYITLNNNSPLDAAMDFLLHEGYPGVNIIDHQFNADDYTAFVSKIDTVIYQPDSKIIAVRSGFSKWKPAGETVRILTQVHNFQYTGLAQMADSVYKTIQNGFFSVTFSDDFAFLAEEL